MVTKHRSTLVLTAILAIGALALSACGGSEPSGAGADGTAAGRQVALKQAEALAPLATGQPLVKVTVEGFGPPTAVPPEVTSAVDAMATELAQALSDRATALVPTETATPRPTARPTRTRRPTRVRPTKEPVEREDEREEDEDEDQKGDDRGGEEPPPPTTEPTAVAGPAVPTDPPAPTEDPTLLGALRRGGLVIYLRHTRTNWDFDETPWVEEVKEDPSLFSQCDRQRLLTDEGRSQARAIGEAFRRQGIPVGRVLSSAWCRTRETAELAFGGVSVARNRLWDTGYLDSGSEEREHYKNALRDLLSNRPGGGENTVIVGHMPQLYDATGIQLAEGEAAVVRPTGGDFDILERIHHDGWDSLN